MKKINANQCSPFVPSIIGNTSTHVTRDQRREHFAKSTKTELHQDERVCIILYANKTKPVNR